MRQSAKRKFVQYRILRRFAVISRPPAGFAKAASEIQAAGSGVGLTHFQPERPRASLGRQRQQAANECSSEALSPSRWGDYHVLELPFRARGPRHQEALNTAIVGHQRDSWSRRWFKQPGVLPRAPVGCRCALPFKSQERGNVGGGGGTNLHALPWDNTPGTHVDYRETYAQMATSELLLLRQQPGALVDEARLALEAELRRRGVVLAPEAARDEAQAFATLPEEQPGGEAAEVWWKRELWVRLFFWIVIAAGCNILALLAIGRSYSDVSFHSTSLFVLVAVLGCALSEVLPERWRKPGRNALVAIAVLVLWSAVWILLR